MAVFLKPFFFTVTTPFKKCEVLCPPVVQLLLNSLWPFDSQRMSINGYNLRNFIMAVSEYFLVTPWLRETDVSLSISLAKEDKLPL